MAERIIPIQIEGESPASSQEASDSDADQQLSESLEQLAVEQPTKKPVFQVKRSKTHQEYLKEFDVLEKRDGNALLSEYELPNSDSAEKIFLVIDRAQDESFTPFSFGDTKVTPLSAVKRAVTVFLTLKHNINPHHEFAVITLNESDAKLVQGFTKDIRKLKETVNTITECETEDIFNLNSLFDIITKFDLPKCHSPEMAPMFVLRAIIFYGRSYTVPELNLNKEISNYLEYPYFTCDILMTHEPVEASNYCSRIFDILQNLDKKGTAYFFPVCRDLRRLHRYSGKLLAHPLQRPIQKLIKS